MTIHSAEPLLTLEETARLLRIRRGKAYAMAARNELPVVKIGSRSVRVRADLLTAWLDAHTTK